LSQARLESQNSNLKMEALQSQMNPHFIFNVLTAVQNLWLQHKNELAMDLQSNFAKLLRKIFQYSSKRAISIEQVEEFLNNYLSLEQIRFENTVDIDFQIEEILLDEEHRIPPLLIQPIIENSFKHGLFHKQKDLKLSIHLKQEGAYLYCCVEDNGVGRKNNGNKTGPKRSSGLSTTKERLFILQESTIKKKHPHNNLRIIDLKNSEGVPLGTKVEIWIPFI
jgi:LytS/YehU family sensor histidine kinase